MDTPSEVPFLDCYLTYLFKYQQYASKKMLGRNYQTAVLVSAHIKANSNLWFLLKGWLGQLRVHFCEQKSLDQCLHFSGLGQVVLES